MHGGRRGHPVVFDASLRRELLAIGEGTMGNPGRDPAARGGGASVEVATDEVLIDLNTPEDVAPR